jgi:hypothetical protein
MNTVKSKIAKTTVKAATKPIAKTKSAVPANSIRYKIITRIDGSNEVYEATAEIPGFKATKVLRSDGGTVFTTRSALTKACRDRANALKRLPIFDLGTPAATKAPRSKKVSTFASTSGVCPVTGASS